MGMLFLNPYKLLKWLVGFLFFAVRTVKAVERMVRAMPEAFVHWKAGYIPKGWIMGAG